MLTIDSLIQNTYNYDELELLRKTAYQKYIYNPFNTAYYSTYSPALLPLALLNKDKTLKIESKIKNHITLLESTNEDYMRLLCTPKHTETGDQITVILCKKGWTFVQTWAEKHGYSKLDRIELYLIINAGHRIRVLKKDKHILIITNQEGTTLENRLFSAIPLIYKDDFTWDGETIEYFRSIDPDQKVATESITLFKNIIAKSKILENIKYEQLFKIIEKTSTHTLKKYQEDEKSLKRDIENYENSLKNLYKNLDDTQAKIAFFRPTTEIKDVTDYVYKNPYIVDYYSPDSSRLILAIEAPLEYIDVPAFKQMLKNINSYLYPKWGTDSDAYSELTKGHPIEFVEMIKDLFLSSKYKIYSRSEIILDFENKGAQPLRRNNSLFQKRPAAWQLQKRLQNNPDRCIIPHMHIEYYDCWSGNKTNITKALVKNDIIGAIDICVSTTKDINVNDSAVFGRFIKNVLVSPTEFHTGYARREDCSFTGIPGGEYKTIWDTNKKCFRTFLDIFVNDYLKGNATQSDFEIDFTDYLF